MSVTQSLYNSIAWAIIMLVLCPTISAQELVGDQRQQAIKKIEQSTLNVKRLDCTFTQTKKTPMLKEPAKAQGSMSYRSPDQLQWQYTHPFSYAIVVNGDSIYSIREGKRQDAQQSRMMKGIASVIMGCVSGRQLFDESLFSTMIYNEDNCYRAEMVPKRKDMKRMFKGITICFDKHTGIVNQVSLVEKDNAVTTIKFSKK